MYSSSSSSIEVVNNLIIESSSRNYCILFERDTRHTQMRAREREILLVQAWIAMGCYLLEFMLHSSLRPGTNNLVESGKQGSARLPPRCNDLSIPGSDLLTELDQKAGAKASPKFDNRVMAEAKIPIASST
jgi:hypothetical protein